MAEFGVNIDSVYQTVQALANKEQRGYITPQEFNLFANQAQLDIFEQYFYDLGAFRKADIAAGLGGEMHNFELGDSVQMVRNKLKPWTSRKTLTGTGTAGNYEINNKHRHGRLFLDTATKELRKMNKDEVANLRGSTWHKAGFSEIVYAEDGVDRIWVGSGSGPYTGTIESEDVGGRPSLVYWGYVIVNEKPTYDPAQSAHFEIHASEQPDLVIKILKLAGVSIEDGQLIQFAGQENQQNVQQENK